MEAKMKKSRWVSFLICCSLMCLNVPAAHGADLANKKEIVKQARAAYYSLRKLGLSEFQANIKPNWEMTLKKELETNPEGAQNGLKMLNGLHFSMTLDPAGKVTVEHRSDAPPPNEQVAQGFNQIYSGMDQAVSGFFATWSLFMLTSPFPGDEIDYQLQDVGGQYRLSYKDGNADVITTMNKNLTVTEIVVNSPEFKSTIRPQLSKSSNGFLLSGYEGIYKPVAGAGDVQLKVRLDYQQVSGLQLPNRLDMDSVYDGTPTQMELVIGDYRVQTNP